MRGTNWFHIQQYRQICASTRKDTSNCSVLLANEDTGWAGVTLGGVVDGADGM